MTLKRGAIKNVWDAWIWARAKSLAVGTAALFCICFAGPSAANEAQQVRLRVERSSAFNGALMNIGIFVNGTYIGAVSNGQTKIFACPSAKLGKNEIRATLHSLVAPTRGLAGKGDSSDGKKFFPVMHGNELIEVKVGLSDQDWDQVIYQVSDEVAPEWEYLAVDSVRFDTELKQVVVKKSPPIQLAPGTEKLVEDIVRVKHEASISTSWKVEAELQARAFAIWAEVAIGIYGEYEKTTNIQFSSESERRRSVLVRGTGKGVRVVWVEYFRTGTVRFFLDGEAVEVPFEFREDFDLLTEEVRR